MVERVRKAKLVANGARFNNAPPIVTHGAPLVVMENLNSALRGSAGALSTTGRCAEPHTARHRWVARRRGWRRGRSIRGGRPGRGAETAIGAAKHLAAVVQAVTPPPAFGSGGGRRRSRRPSAGRSAAGGALRDRESHERQRQRQEKRPGHGPWCQQTRPAGYGTRRDACNRGTGAKGPVAARLWKTPPRYSDNTVQRPFKIIHNFRPCRVVPVKFLPKATIHPIIDTGLKKLMKTRIKSWSRLANPQTNDRTPWSQFKIYRLFTLTNVPWRTHTCYMQPDTLGRCVSDTHGTFVPASLSPSYRGVGWEQSPNAAEQMMSCVRCSMWKFSVYDCFARGVSRVRASCTVAFLAYRFALWFRIMKI